MFCPTCGHPNPESAAACTSCGAALPIDPARYNPMGELALVAPVNTNLWAIAAGYLGLVSVLGIFGPPALICGIVALIQLKARPGVRGHVRAWLGIVMGSLGTVLVLFILATLIMSE